MVGIGIGLGVGFQQKLKITGGGIESVPTVLAWYDPSDTSTIDPHPGLVEFMTDKKFNFDLSQPILARRPTSGANTINGLNVLDFNRQDNEKLVTGPISIDVYDGNDICLAVVVNPVDTTTEVVFDLEGLGTLRNDGFNFQGGAGADNTGHPKTIGPQLLTIFITDDASTFYKDGSLISTVGFPNEPLRTIDELDMGQNSFEGSIGEVVLWRDPTQIPLVNAILKLQWGIT